MYVYSFLCIYTLQYVSKIFWTRLDARAFGCRGVHVCFFGCGWTRLDAHPLCLRKRAQNACVSKKWAPCLTCPTCPKNVKKHRVQRVPKTCKSWLTCPKRVQRIQKSCSQNVSIVSKQCANVGTKLCSNIWPGISPNRHGRPKYVQLFIVSLLACQYVTRSTYTSSLTQEIAHRMYQINCKYVFVYRYPE